MKASLSFVPEAPSLRPFRFSASLQRVGAILLACAFAFGSPGCGAHRASASTYSVAPNLTGDANHPGSTAGWVDTQLYFGLGPAGRPSEGISEMRWRQFLNKEVTPRFPSGLSVINVYGQWQGKNDPSPERLRSKLLIVYYPNTPENREKIDAIRSAWKQMTGDQSVLRVTVPADVSF